ncbi:MAG: YibE/F family protein [Negativicutes bacterium]|nr:YibE/F family protein [Negativicutes bacterium]
MQRKMYGILLLLIISLGCIVLYIARESPSDSTGRTANYVKGVVLSAEMADRLDEYGHHRGQNLTLRLLSGPDNGKVVESFQPLSPRPQDFDTLLSPNDRIIVGIDNDNGVIIYYFSDFDRSLSFYTLLAVFVLSLVYFGRIIGLKSLVGIGISLFVLWRGFIYAMLQPDINIYFMALTFCFIISFLVLIVLSGASVKTWAALLGTWGGLVIASVLAYLSIHIMHLTGLDTEEAYTLKASIVPFLDFHGVLFASMIVASLGAIIDVTISIASAQLEVYESSPRITWRELYSKGMNVGKDIMGAMSITLILAYVGSSLPLLLLIALDKHTPFARILNLPMITTEFVRALVGSIGLIYAIPLTALVMAIILPRKS